jgi:hypothetical protein
VSDAPKTESKTAELATTLLKSVWWAIGLGLLIQIVIMMVNQISPDKKLIPEVGQKVSWSVLVCSAMAIGNSVARARPMLLGIIGLLAAPMAFNTARIVQRGLSAGGAAGPAVPAALELSIAKGLEYAVFGILIAYAAKSGKARAYLLSGLALAVAFTTYLEMRLVYGNAPPPPKPMLIARGINEFLFPIGCAFVLWFTTEIGSKLSALTAATEAPPAPGTDVSSPAPGAATAAVPTARA